MAESPATQTPTTTAGTTTMATTTTPTSNIVTRSQAQQQQRSDDHNATDDSDNKHDNNRNKKDTFKGKIDKLDGHVFQLAEEGRKGNQFSQTLEALQHYTMIEMDHPKDLASLFATPCTTPSIKEPPDLPPVGKDNTTPVTRDHRKYIEWKHECESYNTRITALDTNQGKLFTVILLQCSQGVKTKLEATTGYETGKASYDCKWLIVSLKNICHRFEHTEYRFAALYKAKHTLINYRQASQQSTTDYFEAFQELVDVLESYGGQVHDPHSAAPNDPTFKLCTTDDERNQYMRDRYCAYMFIHNSDNHRYATLKSDLANDFSKGRNEFPTTLSHAHQLLSAFKDTAPRTTHTPRPNNNNNNNHNNNTNSGHSGRTDGGRGYYHRGGRGGGRTAKTFVQVAFSLTQIENHFPNGIPTSFILLDSDSTVSIFCNPHLLADIHDVDEPLYLETNGGGYQVSTQMGTVPGFGLVWYNPDSIANVLSLAQVRLTKFTARQVEAADAARTLYHLLGRPGHKRFLTALKENHILNCPITLDDATRAELIYGKDVAFLKGKTTARPATPHVSDQPLIPFPFELLSLHPTVTLCCDLFYVLGLGFSLSTSRGIRYLSSHPIPDRSKHSITTCLQSDIALYTSRGFTPTEIHADGEYTSIAPTFPDIRFSICAADAHVPEIERAIRTVKESVRATIHGMPYSHLPRTLVKELITHTVRNLNILPSSNGISTTMSPATIVTGAPKPDYRTLTLEFGTYVQVYDGTSNDTKSRTLGAIATNPTGNSSGDYYFMSLATGHRIHRRSWTILPISDTTISRVEAIALAENMPPVNGPAILPEFDPNAIVDPDAYDRAYLPPAVPDNHSDHHLTTDAYTSESDSASDSDHDSLTDDIGHHPDFDDDIVLPIIPPPLPIVDNEERIPPLIAINTTPENEERTTLENEERTTENEERTTLENEEQTSTTAPTEDDEHTKKEERHHGLRPTQAANYNYRFGFTQTNTTTASHRPWKTTQQAIADMDSPPTNKDEYTPKEMTSINKAITGLMFTQMSAHKGIKKHGQHALDALRKEFVQFRSLDVLEPLDAFTLTDQQKADSLRALSVIKEKRDGSLKGRTCADGSAQQGKYTKAETGSPTISNDTLYLSIMIDAFESRDVATADIAGAYLHAHMKDFISMRFVGWAVDLLCDVNPEYSKFAVYEGKTKVLYVRCNKAIYGCVVSGVLWYELFTDTLEKHGFTTNPYDFCVANATIDGSQCTIGWFVDDTKISHVKPSVVTKIITLLETRFGKMKVTRGREHKFLGMNIKYLGDGTATIHMPSYINEAITESGLNICKHAPSPCTNGLLTIDPNSPLLSTLKAQSFHSIVAKLIYVGTRS